jgi:hypothetical protein
MVRIFEGACPSKLKQDSGSHTPRLLNPDARGNGALKVRIFVASSVCTSEAIGGSELRFEYREPSARYVIETFAGLELKVGNFIGSIVRTDERMAVGGSGFWWRAERCSSPKFRRFVVS